MKIPHGYECPGASPKLTPECPCGAVQREEARLWTALEAVEAELGAFYDEIYGIQKGEQRTGDELV